MFKISLLMSNLKFMYMYFSHLCLLLFMKMLFYIPLINFYSDVSMMGCWDEYSFSLAMLVYWIFFICFLMMMDLSFMNLFLMILLMNLLIYSFYFYSFMLFFIFFEFSMFPIVLIIVLWGVSKNRLISAFNLLYFTMVFSFPFLFALLTLYSKYYSFSWIFFYTFKLDFCMDLYLVFFLIMVFIVKLPMYMFHLWLLKAHVDAPVYGSMVLASILLKLGGYGLIRIIMGFYEFLKDYGLMFILISLLGSLICCLICLRQIDMKILVAYSSVVHMNFMLSGLFTFSIIGFKSCLFLMIGHGLCSSAMFYMVNIWYMRSGSRIFMLNKGMLIFMPSMNLLWFLICSSNMAAPVSLNLVGEVFVLCSILSMYMDLFYLLMLISFFSAVFCLYLFVSIFHGELSFFFVKFNSGKVVEYFIILMHWIPLNLLILNLLMF